MNGSQKQVFYKLIKKKEVEFFLTGGLGFILVSLTDRDY